MPATSQSETKLQYIDQSLLDFDATNPRFGAAMSTKSQSEMQKALIESPYFASELVESLLKNGFIDYEPLVTKRSGKRFVVIEGNRRLAAIREILANPQKHQGKTEDLQKIPVLVFPDKPDDQQKSEMRVYLGVRHLLGFREWPPLSKAHFLERESQEPGGLERVFKETQLKRTEARRFLIPFRLLKAARIDLPVGADYWMLGEALSRTGVKKYLQLDVEPKTLQIISFNKKNLSLLLDDIYGPLQQDGSRDAGKRLVDDTRDLSKLGKVLGSDRATHVLRVVKNLDVAEIYVDSKDESLKRLLKSVGSMGALVEKLATGKSKIDSRVRSTFKDFDAAVHAFVEQNS